MAKLARSYVYANDSGNGRIDVCDSGTGDKGVVQATRIVKGPWRGNNRITQIWFTWRGVSFYGACGEDRTTFKPRPIKSR